MSTNLLYERKCALKGCDKTFCIHGEDWVYKDKLKKDYVRYFCSWKHLQQYREGKENGKTERKHNDNAGMKRKERTAQIIQAYVNGEKVHQIAQRFGMEPKNVANYKYKYKKEIEEGRRLNASYREGYDKG